MEKHMSVNTVYVSVIMLAAVSRIHAQTATIAPSEQQIAGAVISAPAALRASATVLGYSPEGKLVTLRKGTGPLVCRATGPKEKQFHTSCYHKSLEPFMARGRALRAEGVTGGQVD